MAGFMDRLKDFLAGGDVEVEESYIEEDFPVGVYEEPVSDTKIFDNYSINEEPVKAPQQTVTTPVYQQPASTVVMLNPWDIKTSQIVCDHIREGHIVICNLTTSSNNQRVVDYISGGVYAFDGKIEPTAVKTTFVCTPKNVNLIVDTNEASKPHGGMNVSAL